MSDRTIVVIPVGTGFLLVVSKLTPATVERLTTFWDLTFPDRPLLVIGGERVLNFVDTPVPPEVTAWIAAVSEGLP